MIPSTKNIYRCFVICNSNKQLKVAVYQIKTVVKLCIIQKIKAAIFWSCDREKQRNLEKIREKLAAQLQQKASDEDERIRRAVEEAEEKRAKEEAEKEAKMRKDMEESAKHRNKQVSCHGNTPVLVCVQTEISTCLLNIHEQKIKI